MYAKIDTSEGETTPSVTFREGGSAYETRFRWVMLSKLDLVEIQVLNKKIRMTVFKHEKSLKHIIVLYKIEIFNYDIRASNIPL